MGFENRQPAVSVNIHPGHKEGLASLSDLLGYGRTGATRVVVVDSARAWEEILRRAKVRGALVVVHFAAAWCAPCKFMAQIFDSLSYKYRQVTFLELDVDEVKEIAARFEIKAMPTLMLIKDEKPVDQIVGANKDELEKRIRCHGGLSITRKV